MKADPRSQHRLLDVQEADTRAAQIAHRLATLPETAAAEALGRELAALESELAAARSTREEVARELDAAEAEVMAVRERAARNRARLDAGQGTAKDLQALTLDLEALARRQDELEEVELTVMERAEEAEAAVADLDRRRVELDARLQQARTTASAATAELEAERVQVQGRRTELAAAVGAELLALYEKIRVTSGTGAAALRRRRCEGCHLELGASDLDRLARAAADDVLRCEESRRILVRTDEAGV